jgi:hypothetical protein
MTEKDHANSIGYSGLQNRCFVGLLISLCGLQATGQELCKRLSRCSPVYLKAAKPRLETVLQLALKFHP